MRKLAVLFLLLVILLTGCWDRKDIESRGYVLGIAVDKYPPNPTKSEDPSPEQASAEEEEKLEKMDLHIQPPIFAVTFQLPILKKAELATTSTGAGGSGGGADSKTWEITQIGNSFMNMNREIVSRNSMELYFEHLQVIVISEEVARDGIEDIIDFFVRDPEMRRRVKVFITPDQAKSILDVSPRIEDYSSIYLAKLPMNADKNSRMVEKTDLGEIINRMHAGYDFLLPAVIATKDEIKTNGAAVFANRKMVGWINGIEVEAIKLMVGTYKGGVIPIHAPDDEDGIISIEVTKAKSHITPIITEDVLEFRIEINVEGNYAEDINMHTHAEIDSKYLDRLEDDFARMIEEICMKTAKKIQEYGGDVMLLKRILETKKPEYWEEVSNNWEGIYPNVKIEVVANVDILLQGIVK